MVAVAFLELISLFIALGLIVQVVQIVYNYRSNMATMNYIESGGSISGSNGIAPIALIPCKVSASSSDEVLYTLNSLRRSMELGYVGKGVIVVDPEDEEALKNLGIYGGGIKIITSRSNECSACSGKNRALIAGLKSIAIDASKDDIVVMLDCDAYHHPRSVFYLSRTSEASGCVVTGYRWYLLRDIYSVLYNAVSSIAFEYMGIDRTRIVWGGLVAMPLRVIVDLGLENRFKEELSDDAVISSEARKKGYKIIFCGKCISLTPSQRGFREFYLWAVRQMIVLRLYTPTGFKLLLAIYALATLILFLPVVMFVIGIPGTILGVFALFVLLYILIGALRAILALKSHSPGSIYSDVERDKILWRLVYVLLSSVRAPLILSILIGARISRRFTWRGTEYCITNRGRRAVPCSASYS